MSKIDKIKEEIGWLKAIFGILLRKVAATLGLSLKGVSSGALTTPVRVHYWATCESPSMQERGESKLT